MKPNGKRPLVSVIMSVYNSQYTLSGAIDSILSQTYPYLEFIICDDASTDNSLSVLSSYKDKRIKIIQNKENRGVAYSLNSCLKFCTGEYIARMDADDVALNDRLSEQVSFLCQNRTIDAVGSSISIWDGKKIVGVRRFPEYPNKYHLIGSNPFAHPTMMIKREVYQTLQGYTVSEATRRAEDLDLWFRFFAKGYKAYNLQKSLLIYSETNRDLQRRTFRAAMGIAKVYYSGCKMLDLPLLSRYCCVKPIISSLVPVCLKVLLRNRHCSLKV